MQDQYRFNPPVIPDHLYILKRLDDIGAADAEKAERAKFEPLSRIAAIENGIEHIRKLLIHEAPRDDDEEDSDLIAVQRETPKFDVLLEQVELLNVRFAEMLEKQGRIDAELSRVIERLKL